jgi:hypothetical protein
MKLPTVAHKTKTIETKPITERTKMTLKGIFRLLLPAELCKMAGVVSSSSAIFSARPGDFGYRSLLLLLKPNRT